MTVFEGETAEDSNQPRGLNASLSSRTQAVNEGLSESGPALQSTCIIRWYFRRKIAR